ncbi:YHYH protein [Ekhidna sp.]|uniref:YHYH protein n=1 Tax=Ekhidna sp. TaxID=2608089 RepID=UPI003299872E
MIKFSKYLLVAFFISTFIACGDDGDEDVNASPEVVAALDDITLSPGFQSTTVNLAPVFNDSDGNSLNYSATSSATTVVTVSVAGSTLTINEVANGNADITVTATDGNGGSATDNFSVTVATTECTSDNSTNQNNTVCNNTPSADNEYTETFIGNGNRQITTNRVPAHDYGNQVANLGISGLTSNMVTYEIDATPELATNTTSIIDTDNMPAYDFGIALNGVPIDPAPGTPFIFEDTDTGEYNWDWVFEPTNNRSEVGLDCNNAHLQPDMQAGTGLIHYHGDMAVYADALLAGLGTGSTVPSQPVQVGWAVDGFPIFYKYGPDGSEGVELLTPSYQLKDGERPGDGNSEPCGEYNGKYTNDYEYVTGSGDLDACNGISRAVTIFNSQTQGTETFDYFYVITDDFPVISRCLSGTPSQDFAKGGM